MTFVFFGAALDNVDVEISNRISLELLLWCLVTDDIGQAGDVMPLEEVMQNVKVIRPSLLGVAIRINYICMLSLRYFEQGEKTRHGLCFGKVAVR